MRHALTNPGLLPPFEARVRHEDGTYRTFEVKANNLLDDPAVHGIIVNSRDITERVEAEQALRDNERHYRTIVETANEGIWIIDADAVTTFVNRRMSELLGVAPDADDRAPDRRVPRRRREGRRGRQPRFAAARASRASTTCRSDAPTAPTSGRW